MSLSIVVLFLLCLLTKMEAVIDYVILKGSQGEEILKEISVAAEDVIETLHFQSPCAMRPHGSTRNGLSWDDGCIEYIKLHTTVSEAVSIRAPLLLRRFKM
jgi:hypothetical protein